SRSRSSDHRASCSSPKLCRVVEQLSKLLVHKLSSGATPTASVPLRGRFATAASVGARSSHRANSASHLARLRAVGRLCPTERLTVLSRCRRKRVLHFALPLFPGIFNKNRADRAHFG